MDWQIFPEEKLGRNVDSRWSRILQICLTLTQYSTVMLYPHTCTLQCLQTTRVREDNCWVGYVRVGEFKRIWILWPVRLRFMYKMCGLCHDARQRILIKSRFSCSLHNRRLSRLRLYFGGSQRIEEGWISFRTYIRRISYGIQKSTPATKSWWGRRG